MEIVGRGVSLRYILLDNDNWKRFQSFMSEEAKRWHNIQRQ